MINSKRFGSFLFVVFLIVTVSLVFTRGIQAQQTYTISGTILDTSGRGIDGVSIAFFDGEGTSYETTSGGGLYSHTVYSGWSGTVTPTHSCYTFAPASASIGPVWADTVQDFSGEIHTYTISGFVRDTSSYPIHGVLLSLSTGGTTTSGPDGSYSFTVNCGWTGTVTPTKVGWEFTPPSRTYEEPFYSNQTNQNFSGTVSSTEYTISGQVTDDTGRIGMDGVTIEFFDGSAVHTETTSGGGYYSYSVPVAWTGTVTPSLAGYSFSPATVSVGPVHANVNQDFIATANIYTISGSVVDNKGTPIANVAITTSTGGSTNTNTSGQYELHVAHGWSGNVTPSMTGWTFSPLYRSYNNVASDHTNEHFFGMKVKDQYTISGTVTAAGAALANVVLTGLPGNPATDGSGFYSGTVIKGWSGTVTPTLSGYTFTPSSRTYTNVKDNFVNENYEALVNDPPQVEVVSPPDKTFVSGDVIIKAEASDSDGIDKIEMYIDDQKVAEFPNVQNQAAEVDPLDLARVFENNRPARQCDSYGNTYSIVPGRDGNTAVITYKDPAHPETLLEEDMQISGWLVKPDGTLIIAGSTTATGERWIKRLIPQKSISAFPNPRLDIKWNLNFTGTEDIEIDFANLISDSKKTEFTCKYVWDTSLYELGTHKIMAKAYDTNGMSAEDDIELIISNVILQIQLERKQDNAWIITKEFVEIKTTVENPDSTPIAKYVIYRKAPAEEFTAIAEIPASQVQGNSFTYQDLDVEKNKQYTYKVTALDENGIVVSASGEKTI